MANKILVARGTKARLEEIKSSLAANELVYATDTKELGVKKANGDIEYFKNAADIDAIMTGKQDKLTAGANINIDSDTNVISADSGLTVEDWNTATKTLALSDANKLFVSSSTGNKTLTIPTNESVPFPIGTMITFLLNISDKITFVGASGVDIWSMDGLVELATPLGMASLIKISTNTWQLVGALE